jgi:hypothetical protein
MPHLEMWHTLILAYLICYPLLLVYNLLQHTSSIQSVYYLHNPQEGMLVM